MDASNVRHVGLSQNHFEFKDELLQFYMDLVIR